MTTEVGNYSGINSLTDDDKVLNKSNGALQ